MILSDDFSRVPPQGIEGLPETERWVGSKSEGWTVYVPLVRDTNGVHWRAEKVTVAKPASGPFLRGQMLRHGSLQFGIEA